MARNNISRLIIAPLLLVLGACAGAPHSIKKEELSPAWTGDPYRDLMVIGVYDDRTFRVTSETAFAEELKAHGVAAKPSFGVIADLDELDQVDEIAEVLAAEGVDAVLSIATIDPGYDYDYGDMLATRGMVYMLGGRPGPATDLGSFIAWAGSGYYTLHVGLWDAKTQKPVWQVTTNSESTGSESQDMKALVEFVVDRLREKGLL